ncbi:hypothetical protein P9112_005938 [Eukaryota sp. TZLM1-RC]
MVNRIPHVASLLRHLCHQLCSSDQGEHTDEKPTCASVIGSTGIGKTNLIFNWMGTVINQPMEILQHLHKRWTGESFEGFIDRALGVYLSRSEIFVDVGTFEPGKFIDGVLEEFGIIHNVAFTTLSEISTFQHSMDSFKGNFYHYLDASEGLRDYINRKHKTMSLEELCEYLFEKYSGQWVFYLDESQKMSTAAMAFAHRVHKLKLGTCIFAGHLTSDHFEAVKGNSETTIRIKPYRLEPLIHHNHLVQMFNNITHRWVKDNFPRSTISTYFKYDSVNCSYVPLFTKNPEVQSVLINMLRRSCGIPRIIVQSVKMLLSYTFNFDADLRSRAGADLPTIARDFSRPPSPPLDAVVGRFLSVVHWMIRSSEFGNCANSYFDNEYCPMFSTLTRFAFPLLPEDKVVVPGDKDHSISLVELETKGKAYLTPSLLLPPKSGTNYQLQLMFPHSTTRRNNLSSLERFLFGFSLIHELFDPTEQDFGLNLEIVMGQLILGRSLIVMCYSDIIPAGSHSCGLTKSVWRVFNLPQPKCLGFSGEEYNNFYRLSLPRLVDDAHVINALGRTFCTLFDLVTKLPAPYEIGNNNDDEIQKVNDHLNMLPVGFVCLNADSAEGPDLIFKAIDPDNGRVVLVGVDSKLKNQDFASQYAKAMVHRLDNTFVHIDFLVSIRLLVSDKPVRRPQTAQYLQRLRGMHCCQDQDICLQCDNLATEATERHILVDGSFYGALWRACLHKDSDRKQSSAVEEIIKTFNEVTETYQSKPL